MARVYSTYEAKARLSELLDQVRRGDVVTITHRGKPVAELHPIEPAATFEVRLADLERKGIVSRARSRGPVRPVAKRMGALQRFLDSRE